MTINTILFDLDGTIADTLPLIKKTYIKVFEEMHIPWIDDEVMKMIGLPLKEIGSIMAGIGKEDQFFDNYQKHYRGLHHNSIKTFPGTEEMLLKLQDKSYSLGVVTSKGKLGADLTLTSANLNSYFPLVVTVYDTLKHKPNPGPILFALKKLNKIPREAIYIGDSPFDILAGNQAGVTTIAVTWGMAALNELQSHNPDYCAQTREELLDLILSLND